MGDPVQIFPVTQRHRDQFVRNQSDQQFFLGFIGAVHHALIEKRRQFFFLHIREEIQFRLHITSLLQSAHGIAGHLKHRDSRNAISGKLKLAPLRSCHNSVHKKGHPSVCAHARPFLELKTAALQRTERRRKGNPADSQFLRHAKSVVTGAGDLGCRTSGRQDHPVRRIVPSPGMYRPGAVPFLCDPRHRFPCFDLHFPVLRLHQQNRQHRGRLIAVRIDPPVPVFCVDPKFRKERNRRGNRKTPQHCSRPFRTGGTVKFRFLIQIGQIAAAVSGGQQFFSGFLILFQHRHRMFRRSGKHGGRQSGSAASDNHDLHVSSSYNVTHPASIIF